VPTFTVSGNSFATFVLALLLYAVGMVILYWVVRSAVSAAIRTTPPLPPDPSHPVLRGPLPAPVRRSNRLSTVADGPPLGPRTGTEDEAVE
jgi:hypothetical protein